jgi:hypothetical protein
MIPPDLLRQIRNDLPLPVVIHNLGHRAPPSKIIEGCYRFQCPHCHELRATVNPRNNLAHCFSCGKNTNNLDLLIHLGYDFLAAVTLLEEWLIRHQRQESNHRSTPPTSST